MFIESIIENNHERDYKLYRKNEENSQENESRAKFRNTYSIYSNEYWKHYQFGDIVYTKGIFSEIFKKNDTKIIQYVCAKWPTSIGCEYRKAVSTDLFDISKLNEICLKRTQENRTDTQPNEVVIHLRLGDALRAANCWDVKCSSYVLTLKDYEKIRDIFQNDTIFVLVAWQHHTRSNLENNPGIGMLYANLTSVYLSKLSTQLKSQGFNVYIKTESLPDDDFLFMSNAKTYIQSPQSGYGKLIADMVRHRGNKVMRFGCHDITSFIKGIFDIHLWTKFETLGLFDPDCYV